MNKKKNRFCLKDDFIKGETKLSREKSLHQKVLAIYVLNCK